MTDDPRLPDDEEDRETMKSPGESEENRDTLDAADGEEGRETFQPDDDEQSDKETFPSPDGSFDAEFDLETLPGPGSGSDDDATMASPESSLVDSDFGVEVPSRLGRSDVSAGRGAATQHAGGDATHTGGEKSIADDVETMAGDIGGTNVGMTKARGEGTVAGSFAPTARRKSVEEYDESETMVDPDAIPTKDDPDKTMLELDPDTTRRTATNLGGGTGVGATARAPFAGTETGAAPGRRQHVGPTVLKEGELLAGRYELTRRLGKGGMGEVWAAKHTLLHGMRAIKLIKASISRDASFRARFLTEGQTMMRIKHPAVVEVTDLDETRGNRELFMVMEHLKGRTLYDAVRDKDDPLGQDQRTVARIFKEMALGMQRIHDEGIVHKDMKTDNVLLVVGEDGLEHPKVIDFGLAKSIQKKDSPITEESTAVDEGGDPDMHTTLSGTLAYMAPEQFLGIPSSFQSDIYAMGVMIFESFNQGEYPVPRGGLTHYLKLHKDGYQPAKLGDKAPGIDPYIAQLADRCMAIRKEDRPKSMQEVADAFQWWLDTPIRAEKRKKRLQLAGAAVFFVGLAVAGWAMGGGPSANLNAAKLTAGADGALPSDGSAYYVDAASLPMLVFTAQHTGSKGVAALTINGEDHPIDAAIDDGVFTAPIDLSSLEDGRYELVIRPHPEVDTTETLAVVVDRTAPVVSGVTLQQSADQRYTNASTPEITVRVDDANLRSVDARNTASGKDVIGTRKGDGWSLTGFADKEGPVAIDVTATDHAGNGVTQRVEFVWKTKLKRKPVIARAEGVGNRRDVNVRTPVGAKLSVEVFEPGKLRLTSAGETVFEQDVDGAGDVEIALPNIPANGSLETALTFTDPAQNSDTTTVMVKHVVDVASILTAAAEREVVARTGEDIVLKLFRAYPIEADPGPGMTARQVKDARGNPASGTAEPVPDVELKAEGPKSYTLKVLPGVLASGVYDLRATGVGEASTEPFQLTVDTERPVIESVVVKDEVGNRLAPGAWSTTQKVTVVATVSDLTGLVVNLGGVTPVEPEGVGTARTREYTFRRTCDPGENNWTLLATDKAGNAAELPVKVKADWTKPVFTIRPKEPGPYNDTASVVFVGNCSNEAAYEVEISGAGLAGGRISEPRNQPGFEISALLVEGEHTLTFTVRDAAGHASSTQTGLLKVLHLVTELPDEIAWDRGVNATMRKLRPGQVLIGRKLLSVDDIVFVDETEVTNDQYRAFLRDAVASAKAHGGRCEWAHPEQPEGHSHEPPETWKDAKWNRGDLPVVNVTWWDAYAFANWSGRRLPTEAEWVKAAAQMKGEPELRQWPGIAGNVRWEDARTLHPVTAETTKGLLPVPAGKGADRSPIGCLHMGGNVSEWVDLTHEPKGQPTTAVRGGNFFYNKAAANIRDATAKRYDRGFRAKTVGFRCAVDAGDIRQ